MTVLTGVLLFYLLPNVTVIEQSMEITAAPDRVFDLVSRPENWQQWYAPLTDKSGVQIRYDGPSEGRGAQMRWVTGNPKMTGGTVNIRNARESRSVTAVVDLNEKHSAVMNFKVKPAGENASLLTITSRLRFSQDSILHYLRMMFDRSDEMDVIRCLENIAEAATSPSANIEVRMQQVDSFPYIGILDSCRLEDVSRQMGMMYNELLTFTKKSGLTAAGRPFAVFRKFDEQQALFEVGIPVDEPLSESGRIRNATMPGGKHATTDYVGSSDTLEEGHNAIQQWLVRYGRKIAGYPWEMYVTDLVSEPDPNKQLTRIFYPID